MFQTFYVFLFHELIFNVCQQLEVRLCCLITVLYIRHITAYNIVFQLTNLIRLIILSDLSQLPV